MPHTFAFLRQSRVGFCGGHSRALYDVALLLLQSNHLNSLTTTKLAMNVAVAIKTINAFAMFLTARTPFTLWVKRHQHPVSSSG